MIKFIIDNTLFIYEGENLGFEFTDLTEKRLLIIVGLTGVGKTTIVNLLREKLDFRLLPNRRELTDKIIINPHTETTQTPNRLERFNLTKEFRERHNGGMAYILSQLSFSTPAADLYLFDNLRGIHEARYAGTNLKKAIFIHLDASYFVRILRLLKREDPFDSLTNLEGSSSGGEELDILGADKYFTANEIEKLSSLIRDKKVTNSELNEKFQILAKERENYNPEKTKEILSNDFSNKAIFVDTNQQSPSQIVTFINKELQKINL